jgi:hypothetical protein
MRCTSGISSTYYTLVLVCNGRDLLSSINCDSTVLILQTLVIIYTFQSIRNATEYTCNKYNQVRSRYGKGSTLNFLIEEGPWLS